MFPTPLPTPMRRSRAKSQTPARRTAALLRWLFASRLRARQPRPPDRLKGSARSRLSWSLSALSHEAIAYRTQCTAWLSNDLAHNRIKAKKQTGRLLPAGRNNSVPLRGQDRAVLLTDLLTDRLPY